MPRRAGFTLIELMIVIAIIAVIAAVAIPNLLEARKAGNEAATIGALRTVGSAQALFHDGDLDGDLAFDYASLPQLGALNLIDEPLANRVKHGYHFKSEFTGCFFTPTGGYACGNYVLDAVPATAQTGGRNFRLTCGSNPLVDCEIRVSLSGFASALSPLVPSSEGDPAGPIPPVPGAVSCGIAPAQIFPTTPKRQAAAAAQLRDYFESLIVSLIESHGAFAADLAHTLFALAPGAPVAPGEAVLASLDSDNDGALALDELVGPFGHFSAANAIAGVELAYGSCDAACLAAGETSASCDTFCSGSVASPGEVESLFDASMSLLPLMLQPGIACEDAPVLLPLADFSGDPLTFVYYAAGLGPLVPLLAPPLVALLVLALFVSGLRRARRFRPPSARP